ncbi:hypothetical protein NX773_11800 [Massilia solisilvae]|uniref:Uncharacterized protein n=1 Tax=Massilia solisilvae TaxID=1811225 RepID=A0ABT2BK24_9BURK|nr:hypothetical protein [Massilia solisilvae]MCS0608849.1 hypothetical protein [Massilia solisilvae]
MSKRTFGIITILFWLAFGLLVALDFSHSQTTQAEPPLIALGSGQAASGGHCSGR